MGGSKDVGNAMLRAALDRAEKEDAQVLLISAAAATAGLCGVEGPLTRVVDGIAGTAGRLTAQQGQAGILDYLSPGVLLYDLFSGNLAQQAVVGKSDTEKAEIIQRLGLAASNVVEANLMYVLFRNPSTLPFFERLGEKAVEGLGSAKVAAGIL